MCHCVSEPSKEYVLTTPVIGTNPGTVDTYIASSVWNDFVPAALASGSLQPKPEPLMVEGGLSKTGGGEPAKERRIGEEDYGGSG